MEPVEKVAYGEDEHDQFDLGIFHLFAEFPLRLIHKIYNTVLNFLRFSQNDVIEFWISIHLMMNYSLLHQLNDGNSLWMRSTNWCSPFALCILIIHFYSLIKYAPSHCSIYMRLMVTVILFPRFDILPNVVLAFLLQSALASDNRKMFDMISRFICNDDHLYSKQTKITCSHYYLMKLYDVTREMYRHHYLHLFAHRKIHCNYYQDSFIERLTPKITKEIEENLTNRVSKHVSLSSICISNWKYLWHIVLGYDKFWTEHFYNKDIIYHALRTIYISMLIFAVIQYLCKLYCCVNALKDVYSMYNNGVLIFLLLGEFWCYGYLIFYVQRKDHNRFIVRLYQQRFVRRVLDACHVSPDYVNLKTANDVELLCKYYQQKQKVFQMLEDVLGYDVSLLIIKYVAQKWKLKMIITRSQKEHIQTNVGEWSP